MRTLVIDCATEACSVALVDGDDVIAGDYRVLGRGHAELLVPMIAALPHKGRAERIAASLGPGSFTGVRVGLATARALAFAWQAELVGYPTLALIAAMSRAALPGPVTVCTTGGHGEWFVQDFSADGAAAGACASLAPDQAVLSAGTVVAGSQSAALVDRRGSGHALPLLPDARQFALLNSADLSHDVSPLYGRPPDARLPAG